MNVRHPDNIRPVPPEQAWTVFQSWALQRLRHEAPGVVLVLVDAPAAIRNKRWTD